MSSGQVNLGGLARRLVLENVMDQAKAIEATEAARKANQPFITYVVEKNLADSQLISTIASIDFGFPLFDVEAMDYEVIPKEVIQAELMRKYHAVPLFKRGNRLYVGISDPTNIEALDQFKFQSGVNTDGIIINERKLSKLIDRLVDEKEGNALADFDDADLENLDIDTDDPAADNDGPGDGSDDAPIVRFVNKVLLDAIKLGASDLHFEPYEKTYRVRFRVDGVLQEVANPPSNLSGRIAARLKVMSRLDISERRVPQDGRVKMKLSKNKAIDFRVSTLPTLFGEKIVMRILDPSSAMLGIEVLGYEPLQKERYVNALQKPQGMILVTGPTGSGKTVSLYTGVNILNEPERNISTAEDPVEINLPGINQVNVNPKAGLTFASALKAFLRQDPDIILVGEIRDLETAEIAIKAAQTGHLVLSTLHTNSAPETLTRLVNMGVAPFNIATTVSLVIAQRLARRLCSYCKRKVDIPRETLIEEGFDESEVDNVEIYEPVGCENCSKGYKGRVGIYQVMPISEEMGRIIMANGNAIEIADQGQKENINDLRQSGLEKVRQGVTSLAEVNRVTQD
ncbi:MAG: type IV-A pilus assembly ATPase PilB [Pseudomonadota bacterium]